MRALWLSLICAVLLVAGCRVFKQTEIAESSVPPDYLEVAGIGDARGQQGSGPAAWSQAMGAILGPVTAEADIATSPGGPEALMVSRASARRQALRVLTEKMQSAPMDAGTKLHDWLIGSPAAQRMAFENLIEERSNVVWREKPGKSVAVASIPTEIVANWVMQRAKSTTTAADENALKQKACELAREDAKAKLREQLLGMDVGDGRTLAKVIETDTEVGSRLDGILHVVPVDEIAPGVPGVCQVKIFFDKNIARGLATKPKRRWGLF